MAEAKDPASMKHKIYDEEDEFEIFAVELMTNLMKLFSDANYVVMPKLPRRSEHYSVNVLKSVALVWRFTHETNCKRFRMALPLLTNTRSLFAYAVFQAAELFDKMISHAQLVFLAAYCYELCCFLTRNGLEEYVYVSYTLFTTIWKKLYESKFERMGGWGYLQKELVPYAFVYDAIGEIFLPGYPLREDDLVKAVKEYEELDRQRRARGDEPLHQDEDEAEEWDAVAGRRKITLKDTKLMYFYYVRNFELIRVEDELEVNFKEQMVEYFLELQEKRMQEGSAALPEPDAVCEAEVIARALNLPLPEDTTHELPPGDAAVESCRLSLDSCSIQEVKEKVGTDSENASKDKSIEEVKVEEGPTAATGAISKNRKSGATGEKSPQKGVSPAKSFVADPKKKTEPESGDRAEKMKQPEWSKSPNKKPAGGKSGSIQEVKEKVGTASEDTSKDKSSEEVKVEEGQTEATGARSNKRKSGATGEKSLQKEASPAKSFVADPKKKTEPESGDRNEKIKQPGWSKSPSKKSTGGKSGSKSAKGKGKSGK